MTINKRKKNYKLRRRVKRTIASITLVMAVVVAAIPVENYGSMEASGIAGDVKLLEEADKYLLSNNELKERIRKNVKEKIAVSNIREEFDMKTTNKRKIIYGITSSAAVFILGFGIIIGTNTFNNNQGQNNTHYGISDLQDVKNNKESLKTELNIYRVASLTSSDMDVKYDNYNQKMPQEIWKKI